MINLDTSKALEQFIKDEQSHMLRDLEQIIEDCKATMQFNPKEYTEHGCDEPTIDIRLCIDPISTNSNPFSLTSELIDTFDWIFRTGSVDYDQRHSRYCAASCIGLDTKPMDLLTELVDQVFEQEIGI